MRKIFLLTFLVLIAAACNHSSPASQLNTPVQVANALISDSIKIGGFEGDFTQVNYTLQYSTANFSFAKNSDGVVLSSLNDANVDTIKFGYNGALGAQSSQEYWDAMKFCPDCKLAVNDIAFANAADEKTYTDATGEWVIYKLNSDYVTIYLKQPTDLAKQTVATLQASSSKVQD